jgi:hypothetical protein
MPIDAEKERRLVEDRPPFFRSWFSVYALVLGFEAFLILLFHCFTRTYK